MEMAPESTEVDVSSREWRTRPGLARAVRIAILAIPFVGVTFAAWQFNQLLGDPATLIEAVARWAALSVVSTLALISIDRSARQFLPLSTLLQLSIVFPDHAPSRFKMALRRGTARHSMMQVHRKRRSTSSRWSESSRPTIV